jgi:Ser/Thr protein kinase RdoA (MazF antagonist)
MQSSCPLTRTTLELPDGSEQAAIVKQLSRRTRHPGGGNDIYDERREIEVYRSLLPAANLGTPSFLGARGDLLLIEEVDGIPLWQLGESAAWRAAAAWLGRLHALPAPRGRTMLRYDDRFYAKWLPRALHFAPGAGLESLAATHDRAVARLAAAPPVFVHGDFYPANVLVRPGNAICVVDFELAGAGAGALDLAALVTGLPGELAGALVASYCEQAGLSTESLGELILCARLHLAVRWLGWLDGWRAPEHQAFDWATEAHAAAGALEGRR